LPKLIPPRQTRSLLLLRQERHASSHNHIEDQTPTALALVTIFISSLVTRHTCFFFPSVPVIIFALLVFILLAFIGVVLLSLALRYRAGTARRQARRWVASLNVWMTSLSAVFFLSFTLLLSFWIASAFRFALVGVGIGSVLGVLGLAMTRWERQSEGLFYTPSRWLALIVTVAIAARFIYGWWRATHFTTSAFSEQQWLVTASGTQLSLAVAAGLIGYYLVYSIGVRLRLRHQAQRRE
jgi:hypothetical protein